MMTNTNKRLHAIVSGRVQGVSFRYYTTMAANKLDIVGWVHNRKDGKVELIAEGKEADLQQLESWLYEGSPHAEVESVESTWDEATDEFSEFKTIYFTDFDS